MKFSPQFVIQLPMHPDNDAEAKNFGEYLSKLFIKLIEEQEYFGSKRPFGNSGWKYDIIRFLVSFELIEGKIEEDSVVDYDDEEFLEFMRTMINFFFMQNNEQKKIS